MKPGKPLLMRRWHNIRKAQLPLCRLTGSIGKPFDQLGPQPPPPSALLLDRVCRGVASVHRAVVRAVGIALNDHAVIEQDVQGRHQGQFSTAAGAAGSAAAAARQRTSGGGSWLRWLIGLLVLALLAWLIWQYLLRDRVEEEAVAPTTPPATVEEPAQD
jgi:hypothetical protein